MALWEPDVLAYVPPRKLRQPEHHLLRAILEDALRLALYGDGKEADEAREWVRDDREGPFSFVTVCEQLGQSHRRIRQSVAQHHDKQRNPKAQRSKRY